MTQALHYACQIRYTALCNWIRHFVLTLRISIFDFVFHYADVILCMTLSERILVANRATLEPSATHSNISRHIFHFHTSQHGEQWFGKFRKRESRNVSTPWSCSRPCSRQLAKWYYAHNPKQQFEHNIDICNAKQGAKQHVNFINDIKQLYKRSSAKFSHSFCALREHLSRRYDSIYTQTTSQESV